MLKLSTGKPREPQWLDLFPGVRVLVRPLTTAVAEAAYAEAVERTRPIKQAAEDAEKAGTPLDPSGANGANAAWIQGLHWQFVSEALARYGIIEWEGIGDDGGCPLPVTPETCAAFAAHPDVGGRNFVLKYRASLDAVAAEGNASAPSSAGAGVGAPSTAPDAPAAPDGTAQTATASPAPIVPAV